MDLLKRQLQATLIRFGFQRHKPPPWEKIRTDQLSLPNKCLSSECRKDLSRDENLDEALADTPQGSRF